jgi:hypothetical protein
VSLPFPALRPRRVLNAARVALLALAPFACGSPLAVADEPFTVGSSEVELFGGLVQRITVTPSEPVIGEALEIRSVLRNAGQTSARFLANVCRLDLESTLELMTAPDWAECHGLPRQEDLAPGDSLVVITRQRVHGEAGDHEIRVAHALEPLRWVPVRVRLKPLS